MCVIVPYALRGPKDNRRTANRRGLDYTIDMIGQCV